MLFNSYLFILLFLPLALAGYYACNARGKYEWGKLWLVVMSLWFYAWFNVKYLPIIVGSILGNYGLYRVLQGHKGMEEKRRQDLYLTVAGVGANLGVLFYYKYYDFFVENLNALFHTDFTLQHVLLPLGISFFTFQQVGFLVDAYRGGTKNYPFVEYALFVTFFPQLIAGPIVTHEEMIRQFGDVEKKSWDHACAAKGIYAFVCGLSKKVLLADIFGKAVAWGYGNTQMLTGLTALWLIASYSIQLYFDFSGYCDMARGIGLMFRIDLPVNFFSPYKAVHLVDFWKRWHITLSRFFTNYVYIPLGGSRKGTVRTCAHILLVYLISGIWHGAGWTFIFWGVLHGLIYMLTKLFLPVVEKIPKALGLAFNLVVVQVLWVFFRAETMEQAWLVLGRALSGSYGLSQVPLAFAEQFRTPEFFYCLKVLHLDTLPYGAYFLMVAYMAAAWLILLCCRNVNEKLETFRPTGMCSVRIALLFLWCLVSFSEVSTFLYFNF